MDEEREMRKMKIAAFEGIFEVLEAPYLRIKMYCGVCKKWVIPDSLHIGTNHIYGTHCNTLQEIASIIKW